MSLLDKLRIYDILGKTAVVTTLIASVLSLIAYLIVRKQIYIFYATIWILISMLDYIIWRSKPRGSSGDRMDNSCDLLRETAELVAILHYLSNHRDEYGVTWRINSLLGKIDLLKNNMANMCSSECLEEFDYFMNKPESEDQASRILRLLHECMISNGCESNVSLKEE